MSNLIDRTELKRRGDLAKANKKTSVRLILKEGEKTEGTLLGCPHYYQNVWDGDGKECHNALSKEGSALVEQGLRPKDRVSWNWMLPSGELKVLETAQFYFEDLEEAFLEQEGDWMYMIACKDKKKLSVRPTRPMKKKEVAIAEDAELHDLEQEYGPSHLDECPL